MNYYSGISQKYDQIRLGSKKGKIISKLQTNWIIKNLTQADSLYLEIGCGTGRITQELLKFVCNLVAIDGSKEMIKINKRKNATQ